ncbi:hypothetical protein VP01_2666g1 [Puccinia sorghi]|uniref:Uncharacterized protein n=1 Tax=Puccinia sorghi TaxID=27349 RepID=A0A0L6V4N6_9BASI|nr:hypothetical protein VP01_2666g1 [Puccinia sorghi]
MVIRCTPCLPTNTLLKIQINMNPPSAEDSYQLQNKFAQMESLFSQFRVSVPNLHNGDNYAVGEKELNQTLKFAFRLKSDFTKPGVHFTFREHENSHFITDCKTPRNNFELIKSKFVNLMPDKYPVHEFLLGFWRKFATKIVGIDMKKFEFSVNKKLD